MLTQWVQAVARELAVSWLARQSALASSSGINCQGGRARIQAVPAIRFGRGRARPGVGRAPRRGTLRAEIVRVVAGLAVVAACQLSRSARALAQTGAASPIAVTLDYEIAPGAGDCPDAEEFRASVRRQLGYDPFLSAADHRVAVHIGRKEPGFGGRIRWSDAVGKWVGERRLSSRRSDCGGIAASVAFSVAVQIQLMATLAAPVPAPIASAPTPPSAPPDAGLGAAAPAPRATTGALARPAPPPATAPPAILPDVAARLENDRARPWLHLAVGLGPAMAFGMAPETTGIGRLFVTGRAGWFSLELAGEGALPVTQRQATGAGFSLDRFAAAAAACGHAGPIAGCLTGTLGRLQARGFGVDAPSSPAGLFSQVGARLVASRDIGRYFLALRLEGLVMTSRAQVTLNQVTVWTTPRVAELLGVDLGAHFF
jgi:hypothetical protein